MSDSIYFAPVRDEDAAKVRNDALVDAMLEFSLGSGSNELMGRLAEYFLSGYFIIPMMRTTVSVDGVEHFKMVRIKLEALECLPLCTDADSLIRLKNFDTVSLIEGQEAARIAVAQAYAGLTLMSSRMDQYFTFTIEMLEGILDLRN